MPREYANLRLDLWADAHWRSLTHDAQWLYEFVLSSPSLNQCGVADWRTVRIAAMASDLTPEKLEQWASELEHEYFLVIDRDTEEVLVRSFFRHDGILSQPNPTKGAAREFGTIASGQIRGVISHELNRLKTERPEGFGKSNVWVLDELRTVLKTLQIDIRNPSPNPSVKGKNTSTSTSPSTEASLPVDIGARIPETRLPKDWAPTASHIAQARELRVDVIAQAEAFRLHAEAHDRHAARWNAAFTQWLKKSKPAETRRVDPDAWMNA